MKNRKRRSVAGFTLVELLVVIGIIALLISILLPSLNKARRAANTIKCSANLRGIMQAIQIYAANNAGGIPGAPINTARFLFKGDLSGLNTTYSNTNCPTVSAIFDWQSPVARAMGVREQDSDTGFVEGMGMTPHFNGGSDTASRLSRFESMRLLPQFTCPEMNQPIWYGFVTGTAPICATDVGISYSMAEEFLLEAYTPGMSGYGGGITNAGSMSTPLQFPSNYYPRLSSVKNSSQKICMADGARYVIASSAGAPDINMNYSGSGGGNWADIGSWAQSTAAWPRNSPVNQCGTSPNATFDWRPIIWRHGPSIPGKAGGAYYFNAAFYDGHVETLDDKTTSDPSYWVPSGTILTAPLSGLGSLWKDSPAYSSYSAGAVTIP